ncbi:MAG: argininosuccinate synthase [Phycisphaerae bacterium]|nr:argininosuccinate synthase [Phycisphaerae bacterium]
MKPKAVLAFSGGLDTTYCAVWLREQGYDVHTVTVQTDSAVGEVAAVEQRAGKIGVTKHVTIDARQELFDDYLRYLIFANALRGDVYPLSVSAERIAQAKRCALYAVEVGADAIAHGSTGAGNDQVRFDVAFRVFAPRVKLFAPVREQRLSREQEVAYLAERGINVPAKTAVYSINRGLWGVTIGGAETHRSDGVLPEDAYVLTAAPAKRPTTPEDITITFDHGVPVAVNGEKLDAIRLIERLDATAGKHGVGRGVHVGDTILGIKGRVGFEAPAATVLIAAHRELEKLVLSRQQLTWKRTLGDLYAAGVHEARFFDPLMRDLEAFLGSSQRRVSGDVNMRLYQGLATVLGATSPFSLLSAGSALYGEQASLWDGAEAAAFAKLYGMQDWLVAQVGAERS